MPDPDLDRRSIAIRPARREDLPGIVRLLADDPLGATRERDETPLPRAYYDAFDAVEAQSGNTILVADHGGDVVGCLQLVFMPGLSHQGTLRAEIESVRVDKGLRGQRLGERLIDHAIGLARDAGCGMVQLTSNATRTDARRFYERLGFTASHVGMKLTLD